MLTALHMTSAQQSTPLSRDSKEKVTKRYTVEAFDFDSARQAYVDDVNAKAQGKEAKTKAKVEKIDRDKKAREEKRLANTKEKETETMAE